MKTKFLIGLVLCSSLFLVSCGQESKDTAGTTTTGNTTTSTTAPKVIATFPENGAQNVDPQTATIWVQFDKPMMNNSWSWAYTEQDKFPKLNGDPSYSEGNTKNTLPVQLTPNHEYNIWINTETLQNFKDETGNPAVPFEFKFKTK